MRVLLKIALMLALTLPIYSEPLGKILMIRGEGIILRGDISLPIKTGMILNDTDKINIFSGKVIIQLKNGNKITIDQSIKDLSIFKVPVKKDLVTKLNQLKLKLARDKEDAGAPTAVAGVRGDDVSSSRFVIVPTDLIWEE